MHEEHTHTHLCGCCMSKADGQLNRRDFLAGVGVSFAATQLAMASVSMAAQADVAEYTPAAPKPLKVQPVLTVGLFNRRKQASWRSWGGFHTQEDIEKEKQRIGKELNKLTSEAEFTVEFLPLITLNTAEEAAKVAKGTHDVLLLYAANSWVNVLEAATNPEKDTIVFLRHKSGPVYLWYEVVHNRYLRKTVDEYGQPGVDYRDVVVDRPGEVLWRLRALYGLKNTMGKKIIAIGGASGWGAGGREAPKISQELWKMDIQTVDYPTMGELIKKARQNTALVDRCKKRAGQYMAKRGVKLETEGKYVENAFVLAEIFKALMHEAGTDAITINNCMGTIMPMAETTACMPLSLLNDAGYMAFCESDFVVIPSGILLHHISSLPMFFNDPTYPHDGVVTLAHCTAPRKMDGRKLEPVRILTHFESDYGASPKVEMKIGQTITVIDPDFTSKRWLGFEGEIIDNPFLDICRSQIDVRIKGSCDKLNAETKGFHWMACYGNYLREIGYALRKVGIEWMDLSEEAKA